MNPAERRRIYNRERYRRLRREYVALLGGKCADCGTSESLEFDHVDASMKSFDIGRLLNVSKAARDAEIQKCVLRCTSCHHAKSLREGDLPSVGHGEGKSGKRNCPCAPCRARKAEYMKEYMPTYKRNRKSSPI